MGHSLKRLDVKNKKKRKGRGGTNKWRQTLGDNKKDKECNLTESDIGKCHAKSTRKTYGKPAANAAVRSIARNMSNSCEKTQKCTLVW